MSDYLIPTPYNWIAVLSFGLLSVPLWMMEWPILAKLPTAGSVVVLAGIRAVLWKSHNSRNHISLNKDTIKIVGGFGAVSWQRSELEAAYFHERSGSSIFSPTYCDGAFAFRNKSGELVVASPRFATKVGEYVAYRRLRSATAGILWSTEEQPDRELSAAVLKEEG